MSGEKVEKHDLIIDEVKVGRFELGVVEKLWKFIHHWVGGVGCKRTTDDPDLPDEVVDVCGECHRTVYQNAKIWLIWQDGCCHRISWTGLQDNVGDDDLNRAKLAQFSRG